MFITYSSQMPDNKLLEIYRSTKNVFTAKDIAILWQETNPDILKSKIHYYVKSGQLFSPRVGIYTKGQDYNKLELAGKIYTPSYISLETVLQKEGVIFQNYQTIFVVSYLSREIEIDKQKFCFKKIKNEILTNNTGISIEDNSAWACGERAFLDTLYLYSNYHFDNLNNFDWEKVYELLPIYKNKSLEQKVQNYQKLSNA